MASEEDIIFQLGVSGSNTVVSALDKIDSKMKTIAARHVFSEHVKELDKVEKSLKGINLNAFIDNSDFLQALNTLKSIRKEMESINILSEKGFTLRPKDYSPSRSSVLSNSRNNQNVIRSFIADRDSRRREFVSQIFGNAPLLLGQGSYIPNFSANIDNTGKQDNSSFIGMMRRSNRIKREIAEERARQEEERLNHGQFLPAIFNPSYWKIFSTAWAKGNEDYEPSQSSRRAQFRRNANARKNWIRDHPASEEVVDMDVNGNSASPRRVKRDEYGNPISGSGIRWNRSLVPFGANSGPSWNIPEPKQGLFSGAGGFRGGLMAAMMKNPITAGIAIFLIGLNSALKLFKKITHAIGMMNEAWKVHVASHYAGSSSDDVQGLGAALMPYGGNYETAAGTLRRFRTNLQNMRISGEGGGALEEASVRYGLNILGTEPGGLARPEELLGRIAKLMETLTNDQKVGLADTLGLDKATYELLAHGEENYNQKIKGSQTLLGSIMGYHGAYSKGEQEDSKVGNEAWNSFLIVLKETGGIIIDAIIPAFTIFMDLLSGIFQVINLILKPISAFISLISKVFSTRFWSQYSTADSSYGNPDSDNPTNRNVSYSVTINKVDVNAPSADSEEVANEFNNNIVRTMTTAIKANDNGIMG